MPKATFLTVLLLLAGFASSRAEVSPAEAKLREGLRNTMLQLRTIQAERDLLAAEKAQLAQEKATLTQQNEALTKQLAQEQDAATKAATAAREKQAAQQEQIAALQQGLEQWKTGFDKAAALAKEKEGARSKLALQQVELQRTVADQQTRNLAMHKLALEILDRYERIGVGTAIVRREPFTGQARVKLENLVQDYSDKLAAQRIRPGAGAPTAGAGGN